MKTKLFIFSLVSALFLMVACEPQEPKQKLPEEKLIDAIYQSLDSTPEQFTQKILNLGLYETGTLKFKDFIYKGFSDVNPKTISYPKDRILLEIYYTDDGIIHMSYEHDLDKPKNPAEYYKLFSDKIADIGYTDCKGYYEDPTKIEDIYGLVLGSNNFSFAQTASNREDLLNHIQNDNLLGLQTSQYFIETFHYFHNDISLWNGRIVLCGTKYYSPGEDDDHPGNDVKDITLSVSLDRIQ